VYGITSSAGGYGVEGVNTATQGTAIYGNGATAVYGAGGTYGVYGKSVTSYGVGVYGYASSTSGNTVGVYGQADSVGGWGVFGYVPNGQAIGVYGESDSSLGIAIQGRANAHGGLGVMGVAVPSSGDQSVSSYGIYGRGDSSKNAYAGYFDGDVEIVGALAKTSGSFKIDHPLDPANKYLYHSFVESPDMKNIYDGVAELDASGSAWVMLPDYFEALNRDFRYQLTAIGQPAPSLYVAEKIAGNRFRIAGGAPNQEVSWQITGTRKDAYAEAHRIVPEVDKSEREKGKYLYPDLFDQPESAGMLYERIQAIRQRKTPPSAASAPATTPSQ
jgi:hypothetical protein